MRQVVWTAGSVASSSSSSRNLCLNLCGRLVIINVLFFSKSNVPMLIFLDATVGAVPGSKSQNVNHILMVDITYTRYTYNK